MATLHVMPSMFSRVLLYRDTEGASVRDKQKGHCMNNRCKRCNHYRLSHVPGLHALIEGCDIEDTKRSDGCALEYEPKSTTSEDSLSRSEDSLSEK